MSKTQIILKNTTMLTIDAVVRKIFYLILIAFIARHTGTIGLGKYTFALSFAAVFGIINDLGLSVLAVREVARDRTQASKYLGAITVLRVLLSGISFVAICIIVNLMHYPPETIKIVYIIGGGDFFISISSSLGWCFRAFQKMEYEAFLNIVFSLVLFSLGMLALILGRGVIGLSIARISASFLILLFTLWIVPRKLVRFRLEIDLNFWRYLLKTSFPFALMGVFTTIYLNTDTVMLSMMKGDEATGLYNAANRLLIAIKVFPGIFSVVLFPVMSEFSKVSKEKFLYLLEKSIQLMFMIALPLTVGVSLLANRIIILLYGQGFSEATPALQILIWAGVFTFISSVAGFSLIARGKQKLNTFITGFAMLVNVIVNLILIPRLDHIGASIGILITEFFVVFFVMFFSHRIFKLNLFNLTISMGKVLFAGFIMAIFICLTGGLPIYVGVPLSIVIYFVILLATKGITKRDWNLLRQAIVIRI